MEIIKPLNAQATGLFPYPEGKNYWVRKIRVDKEDTLLRYMQDHGIAWEHLYEIIDEPEEFDCE